SSSSSSTSSSSGPTSGVVGTWNWLGGNSALHPMHHGQMAWDESGWGVPMFSSFDNTGTNRLGLLEGIVAGSIVQSTDGSHSVYLTMTTFQYEAAHDYYSMFHAVPNSGSFGSLSGTVTMIVTPP